MPCIVEELKQSICVAENRHSLRDVFNNNKDRNKKCNEEKEVVETLYCDNSS